jgi:multidrug efflux pump subunit AcrA (membrane-fusion protein)
MLGTRFRNYGHVFGNRSLTVAALTRTVDPDANMLKFAREPRVRAATVKERLPNTLLNSRNGVPRQCGWGLANPAGRASLPAAALHAAVLLALAVAIVTSVGCSAKGSAKAGSGDAQPALTTVGTVAITRKPIFRQLTVSSELVPFQEIDVYAKESGFVKQLLVDYGSHVQANQLLAVLEIPELEAQLQQDAAAINNERDMVTHAQHEQSRVEAQHNVYHLQYTRLKNVADKTPGLVAQQEVDDWQGKDMAAESQVEAAEATFQSAQSQLQQAQAKEQHDRVLFDYSKIYAPFAGVVTQRYANLGTLVQAGPVPAPRPCRS